MKRSTPTSSAWTILIKNDSILCQEKNSREIVKFLISYATAEKQFKNVKNIPLKNRNCEFSKKKIQILMLWTFNQQKAFLKRL